MEKTIQFSIIVPVYNMEQYLVRCLDSIVSQDYDSFEVICVNDGSFDGSRKILEEYAQKDNRVVVVNKTNAGLGEARNTGLEHARGDYVWFVDSDDWIEKGALTKLSQYITQTNYTNAYIIDMVQTDGKSYMKVVKGSSRNQGLMSSTRYAKDLLLYEALFFAQNKIYKYDFIKDYRFNTGFYEDVPQIVLFGEQEFDVFIMHEPLYYYYSREGSIMKTVDKRVFDIFKQMDTVYKGLYNKKDFRIYCTHLFYYSIGKTYKSIKGKQNKELYSEFVPKVKERKHDYESPYKFLFFSDVSLRRKIKLISSLKNYLFLLV